MCHNFSENKAHESTFCRGGSGTAATSKMELFVIIVNGFQPTAEIIVNGFQLRINLTILVFFSITILLLYYIIVIINIYSWFKFSYKKQGGCFH